jgi:hypothetical protein|tara:strand:+ start:106 stop:525 length:420 start_codon:yes stop_codon:yes gene_type:complete
MQTLNIPQEILDAYTSFLKRNSDIRYIVTNMTDDHTTLQIVPDGIIAKGTTWADMMKLVDPAAPYFIFFTLNYTTDDGLNKEEKSLMMYTPESLPTAMKMVYAQSKGQIQAKCNKLHQKFEFHGVDDLDEENIIAKSKK